MTILLTPVEARVLGSLVEKEITTPEYYPLSLNALVNACNQKNNREPVTSFDEDEVRQALHGLEDKNLAGPKRGQDGGVAKYEHWMQEVFNFTRGEVAVVCVLLLRGPQTPGELRGRSERMYPFAELEDVHQVLKQLMRRDPPLVTVLERQPGTKEARYAHLFYGEADQVVEAARTRGRDSSSDGDRVSRLETEVATLRQELAEIRTQVAKLLQLIE